MVIDQDGISLAELDFAVIVGGDVEGELEGCGVGGIESGGGERSEERG